MFDGPTRQFPLKLQRAPFVGVRLNRTSVPPKRPSIGRQPRAVTDQLSARSSTRWCVRKPSYDRAALTRIRALLDSPHPPSLGAIARAEGVSKQTAFRIKQDPMAAEAALVAWGL